MGRAIQHGDAGRALDLRLQAARSAPLGASPTCRVPAERRMMAAARRPRRTPPRTYRERTTPLNLIVTDIAQTRLHDLVGAKAAESNQAIRIFAQGGGCGCSGASFGMGLDAATDEDAVITVGPLTFIVDPMSVPALEDASIDYIEDVMQQGFAITAPNATSMAGAGCGCGGAHGH